MAVADAVLPLPPPPPPARIVVVVRFALTPMLALGRVLCVAGGSPRLPVLRRCVGHLRGRGCTDRGAPLLGRGLRPLPLPPGAHVRGSQGLRLQLPCVRRACRPVGVRGLRDCTCIWIHSGIQEERLRTNHAGVGCRLVKASAPCGAWIGRGCGLLPASARWSSGSNDVATCGGIDISGGNGWFCNRGCGDIWYTRETRQLAL